MVTKEETKRLIELCNHNEAGEITFTSGGGENNYALLMELCLAADRLAALDAQPLTMDFGEAIKALKAGERVARAGWNGKGMWLCLMPGTIIPADLVNGRTKKFWPEGDLPVQSYIVMRSADGKWCVGWLASQADMLADDWSIVLRIDDGEDAPSA